MKKRSRVRNTRINSADKEDRISALQDSVIQHILTFLPSTKEAIRTSILSKRWRHQWTQVPVLVFKPSSDSGIDYFRFIENTLILHDSPKIKKFHLQYAHEDKDDEPKFDYQFTSKICFAIRRYVEELSVICNDNVGTYWLPENLFDSASLVSLELVNCDFMPNWRVSWPSLKSLKLDFRGLDSNKGGRGIGNVVSGSPSLECLEFSGFMAYPVNIFSKSLKVLSFVVVNFHAAVKISCPNLVELIVDNWCSIDNQMIENVLSGSPLIHTLKLAHCYPGFYKLVIASKSLKVLDLHSVQISTIEVSCPNLEKLDMLLRDGKMFQALNLPSSLCATVDYICPREHISVNKMMGQFQHVDKLKIGCKLFEFVSKLDMEGRMSLPSLNSKCLTLNVGCDFGLAIPGIAYALHSPLLEELVIKFKFMNHKDAWDKDFHDYWNSNGYTGLTCLVSCLKIVKITGLSGIVGECKLVFEFIEFILTNAKVLKQIIVVLKGTEPDFVFEVSQKLLTFPRYSRSACIELLRSTEPAIWRP